MKKYSSCNLSESMSMLANIMLISMCASLRREEKKYCMCFVDNREKKERAQRCLCTKTKEKECNNKEERYEYLFLLLFFRNVVPQMKLD